MDSDEELRGSEIKAGACEGGPLGVVSADGVFRGSFDFVTVVDDAAVDTSFDVDRIEVVDVLRLRSLNVTLLLGTGSSSMIGATVVMALGLDLILPEWLNRRARDSSGDINTAPSPSRSSLQFGKASSARN